MAEADQKAEKGDKKPKDTPAHHSKWGKWGLYLVTLLGIVGLVIIGVIAFTTDETEDSNTGNSDLSEDASLAESFAIAEVGPDVSKEGEFIHLLNVAKQFALEENYERAIEYYDTASELFPDDNDKQGEVAASSYEIYQKLGQNDKYLEVAQKAVDWFVSSYESNGSAGIQALDIARLYADLGNNEKAREYYQKLINDSSIGEVGELTESEFKDYVQTQIDELGT